MSLHEQLYQWTAQGGLDASSARRLWALSGAGQAPVRWWVLLRQGVAALGAGLAGFGVILWVAANWGDLSRTERFAVLQGWLLVSLVGAALWPRARAPLGLMAFLALGVLLAFFGQTYQTGADAWQLFALWAALAWPLAWAVRSDLVWTPWVVVAGWGIYEWVDTQAAGFWTTHWQTLPIHAIGMAACGVLCAGLAWRGGVQRHPWAWRAAVAISLLLVAMMAIAGTLTWWPHTVDRAAAPQFWLGLPLLAAAVTLAWLGRDVVAMSLGALALNAVLSVWLVTRVTRHDALSMLIQGVISAGLLAVSVDLILRRMRSTHQALPAEGTRRGVAP